MKIWIRLAAATCLAAGIATVSATDARAADMTGMTGGGQAFSNMQSSLVLSSYVQTQGVFPMRPDDGISVSTVGLMGSIRTFAFQQPNYLDGQANGSLIGLNRNTALFALLGAQFGGDGRSTFALPDLQGTTMIGSGAGNVLGQRSGSATVTLTGANLPAHAHDLTDDGRPAGTTGVAGSADPTPFNNRQPSLAMTYGVAVNGLFDTSNDVAAVGQVVAFGTNFVPDGYLAANGQLLQISRYQDLYARLGTIYGGDGLTTFALPNLTGRTVVGVNQSASDRTILPLGGLTGQDGTKLTAANLPSHSHDVPGSRDAQATGGGAAIAQEQPSVGLRYMISLGGYYPLRERAAADGQIVGEIITYAGVGELRGYVDAQGQILNIAQYQALYSLFGTTYGGDGQRTFALPDLRGRAIIGSGVANGVSYNVGNVVGSSRTVLDQANLPAHGHSLPAVVEASVPEPATWGAMLLGFGVMGGAMRRRRTTVRFAAAA